MLFYFINYAPLKCSLRGSGDGIYTCPDMSAMPGTNGRISLTYFLQRSPYGLSISMEFFYVAIDNEHNSIFWLWSLHSLAICLIFVVYCSEVRFILNCTFNAKIINVSVPPILLLPYALLWNFPLGLLGNVRYSV